MGLSGGSEGWFRGVRSRTRGEAPRTQTDGQILNCLGGGLLAGQLAGWHRRSTVKQLSGSELLPEGRIINITVTGRGRRVGVNLDCIFLHEAEGSCVLHQFEENDRTRDDKLRSVA